MKKNIVKIFILLIMTVSFCFISACGSNSSDDVINMNPNSGLGSSDSSLDDSSGDSSDNSSSGSSDNSSGGSSIDSSNNTSGEDSSEDENDGWSDWVPVN